MTSNSWWRSLGGILGNSPKGRRVGETQGMRLLSRGSVQFSQFSSVQFSSVTQSCPTLCDPMDCSTPDFPVHHQLLELTQTHFHWVHDAIQSSKPLSFPSPPAFNLSQHQGLFQWVSSFIRWPKYHSFSFSICPSNEIQDWFPSGLTGYISLQFKGHSRVFSNTTVQNLSAQLSL